jgi:uncharacterized protein (UPF0371 family)
MMRAHEKSAPAAVHRAAREEVVVARWREQPWVNWKMEEAASAVFEAKAIVVRDMSCCQADMEAVRAAEAEAATAWPRSRHAADLLGFHVV